MATLAVKNVPEELYTCLEATARQHKRTIEQEVLALLSHSLPMAQTGQRAKLKGRPVSAILAEMDVFRAGVRLAPGTPSSEEMLREDRTR